MVTLEPINLVQLPVLVEVFFSVEAPPAVPDTAEEGTSEVHLPMNPHCLVMDCHVSTHCTGEVVRPATIIEGSLQRKICFFLTSLRTILIH